MIVYYNLIDNSLNSGKGDITFEYGLKEKFNYFILIGSRFYSGKMDVPFEC